MRSLLNGFLFVGIVIGVLAESAMALESASKINAEILLRQYFRNEVVIYSSQVENRCGRIGLNSKVVDQILAEEIDAAELLAMHAFLHELDICFMEGKKVAGSYKLNYYAFLLFLVYFRVLSTLKSPQK